MKRKVTFLALCAMLFALCFSAEAQQLKKVWRIGYVANVAAASDSARADAIRVVLRELGYVEGQNIATEYRYTEGKRDRLPDLLAELVRLKVDVIVVAGGSAVVRAAKNATKTIPIVMVGQGLDPVEAGLVESLAHPPAATLLALPTCPAISAASVWSCSKTRCRIYQLCRRPLPSQ